MLFCSFLLGVCKQTTFFATIPRVEMFSVCRYFVASSLTSSQAHHVGPVLAGPFVSQVSDKLGKCRPPKQPHFIGQFTREKVHLKIYLYRGTRIRRATSDLVSQRLGDPKGCFFSGLPALTRPQRIDLLSFWCMFRPGPEAPGAFNGRPDPLDTPEVAGGLKAGGWLFEGP